MKIKLKYKLGFSHIVLSLILIFTLLYATNVIFRKSFNEYVTKNQQFKNEQIVNDVSNLFRKNKVPSYEELYKIGMKAFDDGIILMVNETYDNQLICISDIYEVHSDDMLYKMEQTMKNIYPNFKGDYKEDIYVLENNGVQYGYVTLGYYGPFYYNDFDIEFINSIQNIYIIIGLVFVLLTVIFSLIISKSIAKPLTLISDETKRIENGNYNTKINFNTTTEELLDLKHSINSLSDNLNKQQEIKKRIAGNYAHEIRTPLMCISSTIEGIIDGVLDCNEERLESIKNEVLRLSTMVNKLDELVETAQSEIVLNKEYFEIIPFIEKALLNFENEFNNKNIKYKITSNIHKRNKDNFSLSLYADKDKLKGVFVNLISNAIKYTDNGGEVKINVQFKNGKHKIIIKDTGIGIEEKNIPLIFEHLYRVDESRVKEVEGYGIGLSIVKNIIVAHGGQIEVVSKIGHGSEFIIIL